MEFAWVPLLARMPLFLPDATAFSRSMMIGKLSFLTVWTLAYWLSKILPNHCFLIATALVIYAFFQECTDNIRRTISCWKDSRLCLVFPFATTMGCIRASSSLIEARTEKPSREIKMRLGREQNPFLVQTNTGEGSNWKISHHSSKYTLVCHVAEDCRKLVKNPEIHWHNLRFSILELAVDSFSGFLITSSGCLDFKLLVYIFQGRPSLKG